MSFFDSLFGGAPSQPQTQPTTKPVTGLLGSIDPETMGLLSMGASMMANSGPSTMPRSFGQIMGNGVQAGLQSYGAALDHQMKRQEMNEISEYRKAQAAQLNQKAADAKEMNDFFAKRFGITQPGTMPAADMDASVQALGQGAKLGDIGPTVTNAARMDAIRPPAIQGPNSNFPFSVNDLAYLKTKGVDLTDVYKLATDPIQMAAGNVYKDRVTGVERYIPKVGEGMNIGPNGVVSLAPGYVASNNAVKGGEARVQEQAKAEADPFYGMDAQGNKVLLGSRANALGLGSGYAGIGGMPSPTQGQGQQPGAPGGAGGPIMVERNSGATTYDTTMAKEYADRATNISKAGFNAPSQIAKLQRIGQLLDDHDGGKFSNNALALSQYANSLGIKLDPKLGNKEAAVALSNELALAARDPSSGGGMPGNLSNSDRDYLAGMQPGLSQSKDGRQQMINAGIAIQKRNQVVADMARKYAKKYGRVDDGFYSQLQDWSERNPLFGGGR